MQKTIAGVVGAVGALSVVHSANSAPAAVEHSIAHPASYKELLQPISNARELLRKIEAADVPAAELLEVQYWRHHHHHHHHGYYRLRYHHHHHHRYGRPYNYQVPPLYGYSYPLPSYRRW